MLPVLILGGRLEVILWLFVSGLWIFQNALLRRWIQSRCACTQPHFLSIEKRIKKRINFLPLSQIFTMWSSEMKSVNRESLKRKMCVNVGISFDGFQVRVLCGCLRQERRTS